MTLAWYENNTADPTFVNIATNADFAHHLFVADIDGDGGTDIVSASQYDDKIARMKMMVQIHLSRRLI